MGMLSVAEVKVALKNNLKQWVWDIRPSYPLNQDEAEVILTMLGEIRNEGEEMQV